MYQRTNDIILFCWRGHHSIPFFHWWNFVHNSVGLLPRHMSTGIFATFTEQIFDRWGMFVILLFTTRHAKTNRRERPWKPQWCRQTFTNCCSCNSSLKSGRWYNYRQEFPSCGSLLDIWKDVWMLFHPITMQYLLNAILLEYSASNKEEIDFYSWNSNLGIQLFQ